MPSSAGTLVGHGEHAVFIGVVTERDLAGEISLGRFSLDRDFVGKPPGSAKHRATASASSGDGNPRRLISCLLSKTSWPALLNLYPHETKSACNESLSGKLKRPPSNAFFKFDHISAQRLLGPPATSPFSSRAAGGSTGLPPKFTA